jgi:hypothetical protein
MRALVGNHRGEVERFVKFRHRRRHRGSGGFRVLNLHPGVSAWPNGWQHLFLSAAVLSNFTWNRLLTFPESRERAVGGNWASFSW